MANAGQEATLLKNAVKDYVDFIFDGAARTQPIVRAASRAARLGDAPNPNEQNGDQSGRRGPGAGATCSSSIAASAPPRFFARASGGCSTRAQLDSATRNFSISWTAALQKVE